MDIINKVQLSNMVRAISISVVACDRLLLLED